MNNKRRQAIRAVIAELENTSNTVSNICDEEYDAFENMPENLEGTDRYMDMEANIYHLEDARNGIDDVVEILSGIL